MINIELLVEEIQGALGRSVLFLIHLTGSALDSWSAAETDGSPLAQADIALIGSVIAAHDGNLKTTTQEIVEQVQAVTEGAEDEARTVPDFMAWTPAQAEAWILANVTDLATAKNALSKMAMNVAALNAKAFPNIRVEKGGG